MRKLSNPLALAVMSLLFERPMHPYEMAETLRQRGKETSLKLRYGSLYTVIRLLIREGFIAEKERTRDGGRPERTVYMLLPAGKAEMRSWLAELLSRPAKEFPQFEAGLSLMPVLPPEEAIACLTERLRLLSAEIERLRADAAKGKELGLASLFLVETDYELAMADAERRFVEDLAARISSGDLGGVDLWRNFHAEHR